MYKFVVKNFRKMSFLSIFNTKVFQFIWKLWQLTTQYFSPFPCQFSTLKSWWWWKLTTKTFIKLLKPIFANKYNNVQLHLMHYLSVKTQNLGRTLVNCPKSQVCKMIFIVFQILFMFYLFIQYNSINFIQKSVFRT